MRWASTLELNHILVSIVSTVVHGEHADSSVGRWSYEGGHTRLRSFGCTAHDILSVPTHYYNHGVDRKQGGGAGAWKQMSATPISEWVWPARLCKLVQSLIDGRCGRSCFFRGLWRLLWRAKSVLEQSGIHQTWNVSHHHTSDAFADSISSWPSVDIAYGDRSASIAETLRTTELASVALVHSHALGMLEFRGLADGLAERANDRYVVFCEHLSAAIGLRYLVAPFLRSFQAMVNLEGDVVRHFPQVFFKTACRTIGMPCALSYRNVLAQLVSSVTPRQTPFRMAEIGASTGATACSLLHSRGNIISSYIAVEPYNELVDLAACKSPEQVSIVKKASLEAASTVEPRSLDIVFVDGDHSLRAVRDDILTWRSRLLPRGILAGHDFHFTHMEVMASVLVSCAPGIIHVYTDTVFVCTGLH